MADQSDDPSKSAAAKPSIDSTPTLREIKPPQSDTLPEQAGLYVPPRPLPGVSNHRTIDLRPVRLSPDVDPRRAPTELRLSAPLPPRNRLGLAWVAVGVGALLAALVVLALSTEWLTPNGERAPPSGEKTTLAPTAEPPRAAAPARVPVSPVPVAALSSSPRASASQFEPARTASAPPARGVPSARARPSASARAVPARKRQDPWLE